MLASADRRTTRRAVGATLAALSDRRLTGLLAGARPLGTGIGGQTVLMDVADTPVFVKRVPLTDLELRPENLRSTANLFGLPTFCQYGLGSPGFGAWRELAAHVMTTEWVLGGDCAGFPVMYHWRVLPEPGGRPLPDELADVEAAVGFWHGSPAVRERVDAIRRSTASLVLFLEYLPWTVHDWFAARLAEGAVEDAAAMLARELSVTTSFMESRGLLHFDAHFENVLTDGARLYFADFGLATSSRFDLDPEEDAFLRHHRGYDRRYTATHLAYRLAGTLTGDRVDLIRACAEGTVPDGAGPQVTELLIRHSPVAAVLTDFFDALRGESRATPYPAEAARRADRTRSQTEATSEA
ncbi:hypothetical protein CFN78_18340 [Amycolatopsis antarctica]|uniref:Protein kinase domain-containing protein n=1 Tax=Amycolatopsis antarctica TaxID=1854586 RepID=A0A263D0P3_9PSEU|nr:hypothetical protein [Amycolatopsis antarctica]OZM71789.1 hypothetical protein CFN78_18340 [Amycolatopsis antarctica]